MRVVRDLADIGYDKKICLNLYNEPLHDFNLFLSHSKIITASVPNSRLVLNSNGDYLDGVKLHELARHGVAIINITIHPPEGKAWAKTRELKSLQKFLRRVEAPDAMTFETTGASIRCSYWLDNMMISIQTVDWAELGNTRTDTIKIHKADFSREQPCVKPFREFTIYYDGTITQCCDAFYSRSFTANALDRVTADRSIFDLYSSPKLREIRTELFQWGRKGSPCSSCRAPDLSTEDDKLLRESVLLRINSEGN